MKPETAARYAVILKSLVGLPSWLNAQDGARAGTQFTPEHLLSLSSQQRGDWQDV